MCRCLALLSLACLLSACASYQLGISEPTIPRQELLDTSALGEELLEDIVGTDILELDAGMVEYLDQHVPADLPGRQKARSVLEVILGRGPVDLQYDNLKTYTAAQTWRAGEGNCMSFTSLYIALARELGLNARFQVVKVPPTWSASGQLFINNLHINAIVDYPLGDDQVVDFDLENFDESLTRRRISDRAATARYHSNMGVHWMLHDDPDRALAHLVQSIHLESRNPAFWSNLGAFYLGRQRLAYAESAFLVALEIDRSDLVAISNLARIYEKTGDLERARLFADRVEYFRERNPYYLYHLAGAHYEAGRYTEAISELHRAIRLQPEHRFYRLLGLAELRLGHAERAEESFHRARELAGNEDERNLYSRKLSTLRRR